MVNEPIVVFEPVRAALAEGRPVVALETSVLAQGLPHPRNLEALESMTAAVESVGAQPAWIFVAAGGLRIGGPTEELVRLSTEDLAAKVARRDLPMAIAAGGPGATTVSATIWAAHRVGIEFAATGGIGGVHPGSNDVSADLLELARTPCALVCSGPKSIVDPVATMERLEELGVGVLGYGCDRLPFFLARETNIWLEHRVDSPSEAATVARARRDMGIDSALLICNPVPAASALPEGEVAAAVADCLRRAAQQGVEGKAVTPFLLSCMSAVTGGNSLLANLALLESNARLAAEIAAAT
jgi:pseudouridine-5'-phosphate glycosidase